MFRLEKKPKVGVPKEAEKEGDAKPNSLVVRAFHAA